MGGDLAGQEPAERSMATQTSPWGGTVGQKQSRWHSLKMAWAKYLFYATLHGEKADARSHFPSHWFTINISMYFLHFSKWQALYLANMQVNIRVDRLCCFHPLLQNLRNGWLKLFVVVLVPVQYVYSVYYTISTNDVPKAFGMFVRVFLVMPNRLFDSFLKVEGTPSKVSQPQSIQDEKQFKIYVVT